MKKEKQNNQDNESIKAIDAKIKEYEKKLEESTTDLAVAYNQSKLDYFKDLKETLINS